MSISKNSGAIECMNDLNEFHNVLFDILCELDSICKENKIKYSLAFGSLLGAVRHKGFIPWDDDVDVMMTRENFDKFCYICKRKLNDKYFFQAKDTEKEYPYNICRIRKNNTAMIYKEWKNANIHQGIYIDIYPYDNIPESRIIQSIQKYILAILSLIRISRNKVIYKNGGIKKMGKVAYVIKNLLYGVCRCIPNKVVDVIENHIIRIANGKKSEKVGLICEGGALLYPDSTLKYLNKNIFNEYTNIEFEGKAFMSIKNPEEVLSIWYGDFTKLPPVDQRKMFHSPEYFSTNVDYKEFIKK